MKPTETTKPEYNHMRSIDLDLRGCLFMFVCVAILQLTATKVDFGREGLALSHGEALHQSGSRQQTRFSDEDSVQHPVSVPPDVLQSLRQDARNQTCLKEGQSKKDIPASWFVASEIDLRSQRSADLIILAANSCLNGANIVPFWVFRSTAGGHTLALSASALTLDVLSTRSRTYRDLQLMSLSAKTEYTTIYRFDGVKYRERRRFQKRIRR